MASAVTPPKVSLGETSKDVPSLSNDLQAQVDAFVERSKVKSKRKEAEKDPLAGLSVGTHTVYLFTFWLKTHGLILPVCSLTFSKGHRRLVVYEYCRPDGRAICATLLFDDSRRKTIVRNGVTIEKGESRLRAFRPWEESSNRVIGKLVDKGWTMAVSNKGAGHAQLF